MRTRILLIAAVPLLAMAACSSSDESPAPLSDACTLDGACPSGTHFDRAACQCVVDVDSGSEAGGDAPAADGSDSSSPDTGDGSKPDADGGSCPSIADYCDTDASNSSKCVRDWNAAEMPATWCSSSSQRVFLYPHCQGYNLVVDAGIDTSFVYAYDLTTMQLVGIEHRGLVPPNLRCVAGAPPGIDLTACIDGATRSSLCETADAGCALPNVWRYTQPGCGVDAHPVCGSATQDACAIPVCNCNGKTISRCDFSPEPFAHSGPCEDATDGGAAVDGH